MSLSFKVGPSGPVGEVGGPPSQWETTVGRPGHWTTVGGPSGPVGDTCRWPILAHWETTVGGPSGPVGDNWLVAHVGQWETLVGGPSRPVGDTCRWPMRASGRHL